MFKSKSPKVSIGRGGSKWVFPLILIVAVVAAVVVIIILTKPFGSSIVGEFEHGEEVTAEVKTGEYQAVFLDNNQVYFGKVTSSLSAQFITLEDVYYIQATGPSEDGSTNLVKLGNETHGPEDKMSLNRDHILMVENLKGESKIVQAIESYKASH